MIRVLRAAGARIVSAWEYIQVELHGKYSVERLFHLRAYCEQTSSWHALVILLFTPLPSFAVVTDTELIPLEAPERGFQYSFTFWIRVFLTTWLMNFTVLEQCRHLIPRLLMLARQSLLVSLISSSGGTCITVGLSYMVGYPLPFLITLGSPGVCVLLLSAGTLLWERHIRGNPTLQSELKNYVLVATGQLAVTYVYPAYNFAFVSLSSSSQTAFAMLLPVMKIVAKNGMSRLFRTMEDFKPEMVIFNVEVFHALFVACCMQQSNSINTTVVLMLVDFVQACMGLHDADLMLKSLHNLLAGSDDSSTTNHHHSTSKVRDDNSLESAAKRLQAQTPAGVPDALCSSSPSVSVVLDERAAHATLLSEVEKQRLRRMNHEDRLAFVQQTLQLLHCTDFLLLIEFTEVVIPAIYCAYLGVISHLPNRQFFGSLRGLDDAAVQRNIASVMICASLEMMSFIAESWTTTDSTTASSLRGCTRTLNS